MPGAETMGGGSPEFRVPADQAPVSQGFEPAAQIAPSVMPRNPGSEYDDNWFAEIDPRSGIIPEIGIVEVKKED